MILYSASFCEWNSFYKVWSSLLLVKKHRTSTSFKANKLPWKEAIRLFYMYLLYSMVIYTLKIKNNLISTHLYVSWSFDKKVRCPPPQMVLAVLRACLLLVVLQITNAFRSDQVNPSNGSLHGATSPISSLNFCGVWRSGFASLRNRLRTLVRSVLEASQRLFSTNFLLLAHGFWLISPSSNQLQGKLALRYSRSSFTMNEKFF